MKFPVLNKRWERAQRDGETKPVIRHPQSAPDKRIAVGELPAAGAADDLASFIIEEIERLSASIERDL